MNSRSKKKHELLTPTLHWQETLTLLAELRSAYGVCLQAVAQQVFDDAVGTSEKIWELGSGLGQLGTWLGEERLRSVTMSDPDPRLVRSLSKRFPENLVVHGGAEKIAGDSGSIDAVLALCVLDVVTDLDAVAAEIARVLRPGGRFVHLLDMTTSLVEPVKDAQAGGFIAIPNVYFDPCEAVFPDDLVLVEASVLSELRRKLKKARHPLEKAFGEYFDLWKQHPFRARRTAEFLRALVGDARSRQVFSELVRDADRIAEANAWPRITGRPVSSSRHFSERLVRSFERAGMQVLVNDVARTWDQRATASADDLSYRSLCIGHERRHSEGHPNTLLCPDAPLPAPGFSLIEAGAFVFIAAAKPECP